MAIRETDLQSLFADKDEMRRIVDEQYKEMDIVGDPSITLAELRAMVTTDLAAHGIRPEDNIFSCGIIAARDED